MSPPFGITLPELARCLGGDVAGGQVVCPGPGHSRKDRSLAVRLSEGTTDGFVVHSYAGDPWHGCRAHVLAALGMACDTGSTSRNPRRPSSSIEARVEDAKRDNRVSRALAVWNAASSPLGTVVETYLASRGLVLTDDIAGSVLRFHPACPWQDEHTGELRHVPAMIAAMRSIHSDELTGIHRTALTPDGKKHGRRMLGYAAGSAIKLDADDAVMMGLTVGEGIETVLAARQLGFRPAWALGSVHAIARFPVLPGIDALTILAEIDESLANEKALQACGMRWVGAGREVLKATPKFGSDLNDALRRGRL